MACFFYFLKTVILYVSQSTLYIVISSFNVFATLVLATEIRLSSFFLGGGWRREERI